MAHQTSATWTVLNKLLQILCEVSKCYKHHQCVQSFAQDIRAFHVAATLKTEISAVFVDLFINLLPIIQPDIPIFGLWGPLCC